MATNYPSGIDAYTEKVDYTTAVLAAHVNDLQSAVVAVQSILGITPDAGAGTVKQRMLNLETVKYQAGNTIRAAGGSAAAPGVIFSASDTDTGVYRSADGVVAVSANGSLRFSVSPTVTAVVGNATVSGTLSTTGQTLSADGTVGFPAYTFTADADTGIFRTGSGTFGFVSNGTERMRVNLLGTTMLNGVFSNQNGTAAAPTYTFNSDVNTGMYSAGADLLGFSTGGGLRFTVADARTRSYVPLHVEFGTALAPGIAFASDQDTGIWGAAGAVNIATAGLNRVLVSSSSMVVAPPIRAQDGTAALPAYSFDSDTDTGVYKVNPDVIGFTTGGVQRLRISTTHIVNELPSLFQYGTALAPGIAFEDDTDTGLYGTAGVLNVSVGGVERLLLSGGEAKFAVPIRAAIGTLTSPGISFDGDSNTGFYQTIANANAVSVSSAGTQVFSFENTFVRSLVQHRIDVGSEALPGLAFGVDVDTGMYREGADALSFSTGGVKVFTLGANVRVDRGQLYVPQGTATGPTHSFTGDPASGVYLVATGTLGLSAGGAQFLRANTTEMRAAIPLFHAPGIVTNPGMAFNGDGGTGFSNPGLGRIAISSAGAYIGEFDALGLEMQNDMAIHGANTNNGLIVQSPAGALEAYSVGNIDLYVDSDANGSHVFQIFSGDVPGGVLAETLLLQVNESAQMLGGSFGSVTAPTFSWTTDVDTGMYRGGSGIGLSVDGTAALLLESTTLGAARQAKFADGTELLPGISFIGDPDTGLFRSAGNTMKFVTGGVNQLRMSTTALSAYIPVRAQYGSVTEPSYSFDSDTDTGMYATLGVLNFATGGANRLAIGSTTINATLPLRAADGTLGTPSISFVSDSDTGIYRESVGAIGFTTAGTAVLTLGANVRVDKGQLQAQMGTVTAPGITFAADSNTGFYQTIVNENRIHVSVAGVKTAEFSNAEFESLLPVRVPNGTAAAPAYAFTSSETTGMYQPTATNIAFATGGSDRLLIANTLVRSYLPFHIQDGTALAPSLAFQAESTTGLYRNGAGVTGIAATGVEALLVYPTVLKPAGVVRAGGYGTAAAPAYSFFSENNTGMYRSAASVLSFAVGGVERLRIGTVAAVSELPIYAQYGTALAPGIAWEGDTDTGLYGTAGLVGLSVGGVSRLSIGTVSVTATLPVHIPDGTFGAPGLAFASDTNTGIRLSAAGVMQFVSGGVLAAEVDSLGLQNFAGTLRITDGTAAAPALSFTSGQNTGISGTAGLINLNTSGVTRLSIGSGSSTFTSGEVRFQSGTALLPGVAFDADPTTGFYYDNMALVTEGGVSVAVQGRQAMHIAFDKGAGTDDVVRWYGNENNEYIAFDGSDDTVAIGASGVDLLTVSPASIVAAKQIQAIDGSLGAPAYSFANDTDTGFYRATGTMNIVINGATEFAVTASAAYVHPTILIINADGGNPSNSEIRFRNSADERLVHDDANNRYDFYEDGTIPAATLRAGDFAVTSDESLKSNIRNAKSPANTSRLAALATLAVKDYDVVGNPEGLPLLDDDGNEVKDTKGNLKRTSPTPKVVKRRGLLAQDYVAAFGETPTIIGTGTEEDPYGFNLYALLAETIGALAEVSARLEAAGI